MTQENQTREFLKVLKLTEFTADSIYIINSLEGFYNACEDLYEDCDCVIDEVPKDYPALVRLIHNTNYLPSVRLNCEIIDAPEFVSMYMSSGMYAEGCQMTIAEVFKCLSKLGDRIKQELEVGNTTYSSVWDAISDTKEEADEMKALSEATIWVMDYHYRTALSDVSDGVMKKVLIGKVSQLTMKDLYRMMWLNKLHTKELDEICTKYEQPIPKKEHYQ